MRFCGGQKKGSGCKGNHCPHTTKEELVTEESLAQNQGLSKLVDSSILTTDWRIGYSSFTKQNEGYAAIAQHGTGAAIVFQSGHEVYVRFDGLRNAEAVRRLFPAASEVTSIYAYVFDELAKQQQGKVWTASTEETADPTPTVDTNANQLYAAPAELTQHEASKHYPVLTVEEFELLKADIATYGQHNPIWIAAEGGQVVDGWHRWRVCQELGIDPKIRRLDSSVDAWAFAKSQNEHRRHLTTAERALRAHREADGTHGGDRSKSKRHSVSLEKAAAKQGLGVASVKQARTVDRKAIPAVAEACFDLHTLSLKEAASIASEPEDRQEGILQKVIESEDKPWRVKQAKTKLNLQQKKASVCDPSNIPDGRYLVIYADPPWRHGDIPSGLPLGQGRSAAEVYPTLDTAAIKSLQVSVEVGGVSTDKPVRDLCGDLGILYLWACAPLLPQALETMTAWGFEYKQQIVWYHGRYGTGQWVRGEHELLLIGVRGSVGTPLAKARPRSVLTAEEAPYSGHSVKPAVVYELIDRQWPGAPKVELFARHVADEDKRADWQYWGAEVDPDQG